MKLEDQVCTLEQAKKLKELGIFQSNTFHYASSQEYNKVYYGAPAAYIPGDTYTAFTVAELGLLLPGMIGDVKLVQWHIVSNDHRWALSYGIQYRYKDNDPIHHGTFPLHCVFGSTEAKARAELLICLLIDGKITAEECNKRLTQ